MKKLTLLFLTIVPLILLATAAGKRSARTKQLPAPKADIVQPASTPLHIEGAAFRLPFGIALAEGSMKGHNSKDCSCEAARQAQRYGDGCIVRLRFRLRNHTAAPVKVVLPAGLVFRHRHEGANDALLARAVELTVPAGAAPLYHLDLFGLNAAIRQPGPAGPYRFGPVAGNHDLQALLMTLEDKSLADVHSLAVAQQAIWEVTGGRALDVALARKIAALP